MSFMAVPSVLFVVGFDPSRQVFLHPHPRGLKGSFSNRSGGFITLIFFFRVGLIETRKGLMLFWTLSPPCGWVIVGYGLLVQPLVDGGFCPLNSDSFRIC